MNNSSKIAINTYETAESALEAAVKELLHTLHALKSEQVLLLLSGGANVKVAEKAKDLINGKNIETYALDERYSSSPDLNNSLILQSQGILLNVMVPRLGETLEAFGKRFNSNLLNWRRNNPNGLVVATWGMGADGHVAGISPMPDKPEVFEKLFMQSSDWAVGYSGSLTPPQRVTVTPQLVLQEIDYLLGFISGEEKRAAFNNFREKTTDVHQNPVQLLHHARGKVLISTNLA